MLSKLYQYREKSNKVICGSSNVMPEPGVEIQWMNFPELVHLCQTVHVLIINYSI